MKISMMSARPGVVAVGGLCLVLGAQAQERLREVVVSANGTEQLITDALPHTTVLNRELIERSQAVDLPSLLSREAGFQYTQTGGRGQPSTTFLRGAASLQVLVLVDGVPMTKQDTSGAVSLEHIMLDQVERVEVVRGNVSAIYGSGAVGGVIQVFTKKGSGTPQAHMSVEAGSRGSARESFGVSGQSGDLHYSFGAGGYHTKGFSAQNPAQIANVNPDNDGYRNQHYNLALSYDLAKGHVLGMQVNSAEGKTDFDGGASFAAASDVHKSVTKLDSTSVYLHNQITSNWRSKLTVSEGRERAQYEFLTAFPFVSKAATKTQTTHWINEVVLDNWLMTAGAETQRQQTDSDDGFGTFLNKSRRSHAVFGGLSTTQGAHSTQINLRSDHVDGLGSKTTSYLGYGYALTPVWKLIASTSTAFNVPPLGYLYDPWSGNPALRPESASSREVGLQFAKGTHVLRTTYFSTSTKDLLLYDFGTFSFSNVSRSNNKGMELSYSGSMGDTRLRSSLTLQNPMDESTGQRLVRRARTLGAVGVSHARGGWTWGADVRYTGGRPDSVGNPELGGYTLVDLTARYAISKELSAYGRIENAGDKIYQTAYGYNQAARGLHVGLSWLSGL